jgi:redox-sensing transcriptional repressor
MNRSANKKKIPETTISRLFVYFREVTELSKLKIKTISSAELGERTNLSDAQVRKDLGYFGQFGVSGSGYSVKGLTEELHKILGKGKTQKVAIVGVGQLGSALLSYSGFSKHNLDIVAAFDLDVSKIGKDFDGVLIQSMQEMPQIMKEKNIALAIITVPHQDAQKVADLLVDLGVECILNFAPISLIVTEGVKVKDVDLSRELETLSYFLENGN